MVHIQSGNTEVWWGDRSGWIKNPGPFPSKGSRGILGVRAEKGEKIVVEVKRLLE